MDVSDALKSHVEGGLDKIRTHYDRVMEADVVLSVEKHRHIAEITLHANGIRVHSKDSSDDMYASVDSVIDKLVKQVRKYRDRINKYEQRTIRDEREFVHQVIAADDSEDGGAESTAASRVILREEISMKPMSADEAVMQIELTEDDFLVFHNADTSQVNVLYRRRDGSYGLIEPKI